jgi:phospholipid/cholesterol/gamma-HCH transport system substrate-binding protein
MEPRVSYALVGLFVLVLGGAFVLASLWLVGVGPAGEQRRYLVFLEESVAGLTPESAVKYQGVDVGRVREIGLEPGDPSRVRVLIDVRADVPVNADTVASLGTQGLTGLVYFIELRGGGPESAPLAWKSDAPPPVIPSEPSQLVRLQREGVKLLGEVRGVTRDLRSATTAVKHLLSEENREAIRRTLQDAGETAIHLAHASSALDDYLERLGAVLEDVARAGERLPGLADRASDLLAAAGAAAQDVRQVAHRLDAVAAEAAPGLAALARDGLPQVAPLLRDLRGLTERLDRLAAELEHDPNLLLYGRTRRPGPGERR